VGRTHEGSGIGLALVHDLVARHGGRVEVESEVGRGTTFRVVLPRGHAHLPPDAVSLTPIAPGDAPAARALADEAARWGGGAAAPADRVAPAAPHGPPARVLVVDDNPDLRSYVAGLLAPSHEVAVAVDGVDGLARIRAAPPDLVLSDVMMPRLDGFGLVAAVRADPTIADVPIILLSARAGEEAAIGGLDAGADDYLVKPFSARELLARVGTHIRLARQRRAWAAELERSNRELEAFSYSVSHDLRAPLRAIDGFGEILAQEHAAQLDEPGRAHLERIRAATQRMTALIEDLLELARIARVPLRRDPVDLSAIARAHVAELRRAEPARDVAVEIAPDLVADGDHRLLAVVLANLLDNAWKFTRKRPAARIWFGRDPDDPARFVVGDDGAGFDMAYAQRLFTPFQRLHAASEFEGTGVGLATVQRIIARHGGTIEAEAEVGRGARFRFTIGERR
jgi:signal transduction histidine kinase